MDIENFDKLKTLLKNNPKKLIVFIIISLFLIVFIAYVSGFFSEKGKQHATTEAEEKLNQSKVDKTVNTTNPSQRGGVLSF